MKEIQIICIPYAGGTAEAFTEVSRCFPKEIECVALDYAGHGTRRREGFYPTFDAMVCDMAEQVKAARNPGKETVLFGYSMGSLVVYEMLAQGRIAAPISKVILAAHEAPGENWGGKDYAKMEDLELLHKLKEFGGFDKAEDRFLENRHFRKMFFDPIREDYRLLADYKYKDTAPIEAEVMFFYAEKDISKEKAVLWKRYIRNEIHFKEIGRNHFFIKEFPKLVAEEIMAFVL